MRRFTDLFKSLTASDDDKVKTPSFIKSDHPTPAPTPAPKISPKPVVTSPAKAVAPAQSSKVNQQNIDVNQKIQTNNLSDAVRRDTIDVPVYENDSEWDVVQRSIGLFADNARLGAEAKQLFVKKWVTELAKAEQTKLYRDDSEGNNAAHLGNEINRSAADSLTGLLGTYQAMIDPGRQARMMDELKALRCIEEFDLGVINVYLSRDVKTDLINTVIGTIEEQKTSAQKLIQRAATGQPEAERIYSSTKALANCREMRLNAAIKTAVLKMDMVKYQQLGLQTANPNESVSLHTSPTRKSETRKEAVKEPAQPKISESNWVDEQALKLLGNIRR